MAYRAPLQEITKQHNLRYGSGFKQNLQSNYNPNMNMNHSNHLHAHPQTQHNGNPHKPMSNHVAMNVHDDSSANEKHNNNMSTRFAFHPNAKALGSGAYGTVYPAFDRLLNINVAIKVIKPQSDNALLCPTTIREIGLLKVIKHEHIINLVELYQEAKLSVIYLVFERAHYDLKKFWTKFYRESNVMVAHRQHAHGVAHGHRNHEKPVITMQFVRNIMQQIVRAISFLHSIKIIHRDIKPQNILLFVTSSKNGGGPQYRIKIADFGLARGNNQPNLSLTTEVVTLWYRPIELLLGCKDYDKSVDIWAIGCVLYELITNQPLFPAMCQIETIFKIFQVCGTPTLSEWNDIESLKYYQSKFPQFKKQPWTEKHVVFNYVPSQVMDLLDSLIQLNPKHRISAQHALQHSFFQPQ